jgi:hypothetical protein
LLFNSPLNQKKILKIIEEDKPKKKTNSIEDVDVLKRDQNLVW